jgi:zinc protease
MTLQQVNDAARNVMKPSQMVWLIVGDRNKIENGIRELKLGEIHFIDAEGKEKKKF